MIYQMSPTGSAIGKISVVQRQLGMHAGTLSFGTIHVTAQKRIEMSLLPVSHGTIILSAKQSVLITDQRKMKGQNVPMKISRTNPSGNVIGRTLAAWRQPEMLAGTRSSGMAHAMGQNRTATNILKLTHGKITLYARHKALHIQQKKMKDLSVAMLTSKMSPIGNVTGIMLAVRN